MQELNANEIYAKIKASASASHNQNPLPTGIFDISEYYLCCALINYLEKSNVFVETEKSSSLMEFITEVKNYGVQFQLPFEYYPNEEDLLSDTFSLYLQEGLGFETRKTLASNYTGSSSAVLSLLPQLLDETFWQKKFLASPPNSICDQFCGSGNLILGYLDLVTAQPDLPFPTHIRINDVMPSAVLLAFSRLLAYGVDPALVEASIADGFSLSSQHDLVLINPPYTRSHRISSRTKQHLGYLKAFIDSLAEKSGQSLPIGHSGLHFWAVLDLNYRLTRGGTALVVLPRAVLNAVYSQAMKLFLLGYFQHLSLVEYEDKKAFSQGSELKELLLTLQGYDPNSKGINSPVMYSKISSLDYSLLHHYSIEKARLQSFWNWGSLFLPVSSIQLGLIVQEKLELKTCAEMDFDIIRGIELYGPDIFFLPNAKRTLKWDKVSGQWIIEDKYSKYFISTNHLVPILRKPKLYKSSICPEVSHYVLCLNPRLSLDEERYVKSINSSAGSAKRKFGEGWYMHPRLQLQTKNPQGHIFIIDKLDLFSTPTLAYFSQDPVYCTKNFYVIKFTSDIRHQIKLLAAWLNSTIYLLLYLISRREIGGSYGRLQIVDYNYHRLFPDLSPYTINKSEDVFRAFDELCALDLPDLGEQLFLREKINLDQALLDLFNLNISVNDIHEAVGVIFQDLQLH